MKQMIRRWKDMSSRIFFISIIFSNPLRFKSSFKFSKSRNCVFSNLLQFLVLFLLQFLNRLSKQDVWYAVGKLRTRRNFHMLKCFWYSLWFLVNFENRAAAEERLRPFFVKFSQTAARNYSNYTALERYRRGATFSCRTLPLVPYGLRAVWKLTKYGHCLSSRQNRHVYYIRQQNALLQTKNHTALDSQVHYIFLNAFFATTKSMKKLHYTGNRTIMSTKGTALFFSNILFCSFI